MQLRLPVRAARGRASDQKGETTTSRRTPLARFSAVAALRVRVPRRAFAAITVAPALLAVAWLVPGTGMLLAGRLLPLPMVIIFAPLAVALCYLAARRLPASWPRFIHAEPDAVPATGRKADVPAAALLAVLVIAAGFGAWQAVLRSEQVFVSSDPGVYLQYGYWIAQHGTARIPESAAAFGSVGAGGLDFATPGFAASGDSLMPAFLPGLPLVLAGGTWLGGLGGALLTPAVIGGCALLSFAGLVGRLCGAWWAVAGELVLAACLPEVYTARAPFSEPLVQVLLFGGLCLFIDALVVRRRALAGLAGLALGLTVLVSIASVGALLPAFPVLALLVAARRPQAWSFGAGLVAGVAIGLGAARVLARAYLTTVAAPLHLIGLCVIGGYALTALLLLLAVPAIRARVRRVLAYHVRVIGFKGQVSLMPSLAGVAQWLALVLPVAVLVGLAERPYLQTVRGQTDPAMIRAVAALQRSEGLAVDGLRQYYESSLYWVLWYIGAPALLLACAGAAVLGRRSVEALLGEGPRASAATLPYSAALSPSPAPPPASSSPALPSAAGPSAAGPSAAGPSAAGPSAAGPSAAGPSAAGPSAVGLWGLPLAIVAWSVVTVLWDPAVVPWQPMASHRLVPVVLPGLVLLGVWMSSWAAARASAFGASRAALAVVGTCCVLALALPALETTLNPGLSNSPAATGVAKVRLRGAGTSATYGGSLAAASALCAAIGPSASVLITGASTAATYAPVVRGLCGQPAALVVAGPAATDPAAQLAQAASSVARAGRHPVLLGPTRASVTLPGTVPRPAFTLRTAGDAESLTAAPTGTWPVAYSAWLAVPAGAGA